MNCDAQEPIAVVRDGADVVACSGPVDRVVADGSAGLEALSRLWDSGGFWVGALSYDLGRAIEQVVPDDRRAAAPADRPARAARAARTARADRADRHAPDVVFTRYERRSVYRAADLPRALGSLTADARPIALGPMTSSMSRAEHADAVAAVHDHLRAGDCYQVNLTRRLTTARRAEPSALFAMLALANPAPHGALIPLDGTTLVSASPERFLRIDGGVVETRPIKGTHESARVLATSSKDLAEHVMIIDMARNDLGRVCELGGVGVDALAAVEHHPGLAHLVSTVRGRLRADVALGDVVRASFPPASITGAPKPRVMQIVDELEPVRRGYYCGAHGWIDADARRADLAVTIRTFVVSAHGTDLAVGGGIVADSTADGEWNESCLKAARLLHAAGAYESGAARHTATAFAGASR